MRCVCVCENRAGCFVSFLSIIRLDLALLLLDIALIPWIIGIIVASRVASAVSTGSLVSLFSNLAVSRSNQTRCIIHLRCSNIPFWTTCS